MAGTIKVIVKTRAYFNRTPGFRCGFILEISVVMALVIPFSKVSRLLMTNAIARISNAIIKPSGNISLLRLKKATEGFSTVARADAIIPINPVIKIIGITIIALDPNPNFIARLFLAEYILCQNP